jgi:hypothetical protein
MHAHKQGAFEVDGVSITTKDIPCTPSDFIGF